MTSNEVLLGHADGTISNLKTTENKLEQSVESLQATEKIRIASLEGGELVATDTGNKTIWAEPGAPISTQAIGFKFSKITTHWSTRWSGIEGNLEVRDLANGNLIAKSPIPQTRAIFSNDSRVVIGSDDGKIHVWEKDMFSRRNQSDSSKQSESSSQRDALKEKLRALRNK